MVPPRPLQREPTVPPYPLPCREAPVKEATVHHQKNKKGNNGGK
jgi:hypothetical protein